MLNKKILCGLVALSFATFSPISSFARASSDVSIYAALGGTAQFAVAQDVKVVPSTGVTIQGKNKEGSYEDGYKPHYGVGYMGSVQVGLTPVHPLRVEVEFNYANIGVADSGDYVNDKSFKVTKDNSSAEYEHKGLSHMAGFLNVYYDVQDVLGNVGDITPYLGVGGGMARVTFNDITRNTIAYQAKLGVTVGVPDMPARFYMGAKLMGMLNGENGFEKVLGSGSTVYNIQVPYMSYGGEAGVMMDFTV